jgi:hypothetical protein
VSDKKIKAQVRQWFLEWAAMLGLANWNFKIGFGKIGKKDKQGRRMPAALTFCDPVYKNAELRFDPKVLRVCPKREREEVVVHELVHIQQSPIQGGKRTTKEIERVTQDTARTYMRLAGR